MVSYVHGGNSDLAPFCILPFVFETLTCRKTDGFGPRTRERVLVAGSPLQSNRTPSPPSYLV